MENNLTEKRLTELYNRAYEKHYCVFSDFLNMEEQSVLESMYIPCRKFGGYDNAERIVAGFGENISDNDFPIAIVEISPTNKKFSDKLTHRDFLGALMNLGIKRELLGDIIINDNSAYLFCLEHISEYIAKNISRIKHTTVSVKIADSLPDNIITEPEPTEIFTASLRPDAIISSAYKLSRSEASRLISQGKIFVNSRQITGSSHQLSNNDIISVRGFGRIKYMGTVRSTKKDRLVISVKIYK